MSASRTPVGPAAQIAGRVAAPDRSVLAGAGAGGGRGDRASGALGPMPLGGLTCRGPLTRDLFAALTGPPGAPLPVPAITGDPLTDDDFHLALYCAYELRYGGWADVDDRWEHEPGLQRWVTALERRYEQALVDDCQPAIAALHAGPPMRRIRQLLDESTGPSVSTFMLRDGQLGHLREFAAHRSAYQLKEADPHTWAIPRLRGRSKSAMVAIQSDEYGNGVAGASHAELFAVTMRELGLDDRPGGYVDDLPGVTLATTNLITLLGWHRRWRGAVVGHLAVFEMTSVVPMTRYADATRRLTGSDDAARFYDVHIAADAEHERIAEHDLVGGLLADEPDLGDDVVFGAVALQRTEERLARHLMGAWRGGRSSLLSRRDR